jgi:hypothetical protein
VNIVPLTHKAIFSHVLAHWGDPDAVREFNIANSQWIKECAHALNPTFFKTAQNLLRALT